MLPDIELRGKWLKMYAISLKLIIQCYECRLRFLQPLVCSRKNSERFSAFLPSGVFAVAALCNGQLWEGKTRVGLFSANSCKTQRLWPRASKSSLIGLLTPKKMWPLIPVKLSLKYGRIVAHVHLFFSSRPTPWRRLVQAEKPLSLLRASGTIPCFAMHDFMSSESGSPKIDWRKKEKREKERLD